MDLNLSKLAARRMRQRGASLVVIQLIEKFADRTTHVGSGAVYKFVTRRRINELREDGLSAALCEQLARTSLVMDPITGTLITLLKGGHAEAGLKRYRRGHWFHQKPPANDNFPPNASTVPAA